MNDREKSKVIMKEVMVLIQKKDLRSLNQFLINTDIHEISMRESMALIRSTYAARDYLEAWQPKLVEIYKHFQKEPNIEQMFVGLHKYLN